MKNRFKFRVWDKEQSKYLDFEGFKTGDIEFNFDIETKSIWIEFNSQRYILQQSTGLKDKNGKLIYEGDILKVENIFRDKTYSFNVLVYWEKYEYRIAGNYYTIGGKPSAIFRNSSIITVIDKFNINTEVIGNIYENPELLEVQND